MISTGPIHPQAADIQQHLVGLNAAPAALGVLFIVGFSALVCGLDGCGCVLFGKVVSLHNALDPVLERGAEEHIHQMGVGAEDIIAAPAHDNAGALISQGLDDDRLGDVSAVSQGTGRSR